MVTRAEAAAPADEGGLTAADRRAIAEDFGQADDVRPGLGAVLARFVLDGEGEGVLPAVDALVAAGDEGGQRLSRFLMPWPYEQRGPGEEPQEAVDRRCARRRRVLLASEGFDAAAMRRLGLLLLRSQRTYGRRDPGVPRWLYNLWHAGEMMRCTEAGDLPPALTAARVRALLALDGLDAGALIAFALGVRQDGSLDGRLPGLATALEAEAGVVKATLERMPARERGLLTDFLGRSGLLDRAPALFEPVFLALGAKAKALREPALGALMRGDRGALERRALSALGASSAAERLAGVVALAELGGPDALPRLEAHAAGERSRAIVHAVAALKPRLALAEAAAAAARADGPEGYAAADGAWVEAPPLRESPDTVPADAADVLRALMAEANALARREYDDPSALPEHLRVNRPPYAAPCRPDDVPAILRLLAGGDVSAESAARLAAALSPRFDYRFPAAQAAYRGGLRALLARPEFGLKALARVVFAGGGDWGRDMAQLLAALPAHGAPALIELRRRMRSGGDFRELAAALEAMGIPTGPSVTRFMDALPWFAEADEPPNMTMWPVLAAHFDGIEAALAERSALRRGEGHTLVRRLCRLFPKVPRRLLPLLIDAAAEGSGPVRRATGRLLGDGVDLTAAVAPLLQHGSARRRAGAAEWLGERRAPAAVPALRAALAAERDPSARAAILSALEGCGEDVSDQFAEERLAAEARRELPRLREGYGEMPGPPPLRWADGRPVEPLVVRHWFARAHRLKRPGGDPLLGLVLARLDRGDAAAMGLALLSAFAAVDARRPTLDEANAHAEAGADALVARRTSHGGAFTREEALAELRRAKLKEYSGSALDHRGLLALARYAPAGEAVAVARRYLKDHGGRGGQCRALLDALAADPVPGKLQLVLATAQGQRQSGVRRHAGEIAAALAAARGWTEAELADRAVPTLGLGEDGILPLPVGGRACRLRLVDAGAELRLALENGDGRALSALPVPKDPAGAAAARAARALVTAARGELKGAAELQARRLHGAMCAGRRWAAEDFAAVFLRHPILSRLLRRLVLSLHGPDGAAAGSARLLDDGTLTDAADRAASLDGVAAVGIAHRATLGEAAAAAWRAHLDDYGVVPPFPQFDRPLLAPADPEADGVADRRGFAVDGVALGAAAAGLGYAPGGAEGAAFSDYEKRFPEIGLAAAVGFAGDRGSGSVALQALRFVRLRAGWTSHLGGEGVPLGRLPPVLLSECWADYHALAAAGTGFDPGWERMGSGDARRGAGER